MDNKELAVWLRSKAAEAADNDFPEDATYLRLAADRLEDVIVAGPNTPRRKLVIHNVTTEQDDR